MDNINEEDFDILDEKDENESDEDLFADNTIHQIDEEDDEL